MELYEYAKKDLMSGLKILYLHGFASSGATGTAAALRLLLPSAEILSPDIPVDPEEALPMLREFCLREMPDLVIGTSMGGMYAEQLEGFHRVCVNPALHIADTILKNNGLGYRSFHNPRKDGETGFMVTKALLEKYRAVSSGRFSSSDPENVWGMFGTHDDMVDHYDEFSSHYHNSVRFDGGHQLNDSAIVHSLLPLLRRVESSLTRRGRSVVMVGIEALRSEKELPREGAVKALSAIDDMYDIYFLSRSEHYRPQFLAEDSAWLDGVVGVLSFDRVISCPDRNLLMADYLVAVEAPGAFLGTVITPGKEPFQDWKSVEDYFRMLGGQ